MDSLDESDKEREENIRNDRMKGMLEWKEYCKSYSETKEKEKKK